ncbi:MAG TPA: hypothetical protein VKA44_09800 [Gemmatimonadota bacterium]|nr:hypothetical protein [Gemmatimonadota bacterium]
MDSRLKSVLSVVAACLLGLPAAGHAQGMMMGSQSVGSFEAHGGIGIPTGALSHLEGIGPAAGLSFQYRVIPRVAIRVQGDLELLKGDSLTLTAPGGPQVAPDMNLWHYTAGAAVELTNPEPGATPWEVLFNAGLGATSMKSKDFAQAVDGMSKFSKTYLTPTWGLTVGYDVSPHVNIFAGGQGYLILAKKNDTQVFEDMTVGQVTAFGPQYATPVYAGLRIRF